MGKSVQEKLAKTDWEATADLFWEAYSPGSRFSVFLAALGLSPEQEPALGEGTPDLDGELLRMEFEHVQDAFRARGAEDVDGFFAPAITHLALQRFTALKEVLKAEPKPAGKTAEDELRKIAVYAAYETAMAHYKTSDPHFPAAALADHALMQVLGLDLAGVRTAVSAGKHTLMTAMTSPKPRSCAARTLWSLFRQKLDEQWPSLLASSASPARR